MYSRTKVTIGLGVSLALAGMSAMSVHAATGDITEFNVPTANSQANGIDKGPDGNVWFTEFNTNKVGKITPAGSITEYTVPTANGGPRNIATGPD
jgi:virginiamycin B lyase